MNLNTAVLLPWILATLLVLGVAWYAVRAVREQQKRLSVLERELAVREDALEHLAASTLPALSESVRRFEQTAVAPEVPPGLENSRFAQCVRWILDRVSEDLRTVQSETRETVTRETEEQTRAAVAAAEQSVRTEADSGRERAESLAREATSAAVRSFGTSVVSLGADVSQVVSAALREHRDDRVYETLIRIDHTVQQMIRQAQSYVIVCGGLPGRRWPAQSLTDVVGGATGRVRDYLRVRPAQLDRVVISRAVEPLVHTLASLIDNALRYSPPTSFVDVTFQEGHHGVTVIVDDAGVRMNAEQMEESRQVLANERTVDIHQLGPAPKVGFPGIAALARRYGFTVYIDGPNAYGGMRAMVYIPEALLVAPKADNDNDALSNGGPAPRELAAVPGGQASSVSSGNGNALAGNTMSARGGAHAAAETGAHAAVPAPAESPAPGEWASAAESAEPGTEQRTTVHDITSGGLPRRRRRAAAVPADINDRLSGQSRTEPGQARPDIAAAWQSGSKSGRAAASENTEGMTS
ncbi:MULTISPECIES: ATP-binding protein [Nocardia]|uniref:ATP-binding protein n=1 Tax=Nocardia TaxID=1817 RepID=UPI0018930E08|nr:MULTISPECIES: sensor histidine kinase [Nocardia]MBF6348521.1 sensor histidine kinase [Nocardia flavorosea]